MTRTAAIALLASLLVAACGGGGDDGEPASQELVRATVTKTQADLTDLQMVSDWTVSLGTGPSATPVSGAYTLRTCITGTWRQTLRNGPATLRLQLNGRTITDTFAGAVGPDNRIAFSGCTEASSNAPTPFNPSGTATINVRPMTNTAAGPMSGYDVTAEITLTRVR